MLVTFRHQKSDFASFSLQSEIAKLNWYNFSSIDVVSTKQFQICLMGAAPFLLENFMSEFIAW